MEENKVVKVSAPGKIILYGEHSVVYGKLALAASVDLRTKVVLTQLHGSHKLKIVFEELKVIKEYDLKDLNWMCSQLDTFPLLENNTDFTYKNPELLDHSTYLRIITESLLKHDTSVLDKNQYLSLVAFFYLYFGIIHSSGLELVPMDVHVTTDLSIGSGTGSSASFMVGLAGAFIRFLTWKIPTLRLECTKTELMEMETFGRNPEIFNAQELNLISKWAYAAEKIIHGNPSGIDNTVCTYGSFVSFRKDQTPITLQCSTDIRGLLIDSRIPKHTGEQVERVANLRNRRGVIINSILDAMDNIAIDAQNLLIQLNELNSTDIENCYKNLNELSDLNHGLLRTLGVSHATLEDIIGMLRIYGLHGKLTGAGGGGYVIALVPTAMSLEQVQHVCNTLIVKGFHAKEIKLGGNGVQIEE